MDNLRSAKVCDILSENTAASVKAFGTVGRRKANWQSYF